MSKNFASTGLNYFNEENKKKKKEAITMLATKTRKFQTTQNFFTKTKKGSMLPDIYPPIRVNPETIILNDIKINQTYEITLSVYNRTQTIKRICVKNPATTKFFIDPESSNICNLAPGLAFSIKLLFENDKNIEIHDNLIIESEDYTIDVPLKAYPPLAQIIFDPFLNFGFTENKKEIMKKVIFTNNGPVEGKVELTCDDKIVTMYPNIFTIPEKKSEAVTFVLCTEEPGIYRVLVNVVIEGQSFAQQIDVNATTVDYMHFLVDPDGNEFDSINFGDLYFGEERKFLSYFINNTPETSNYNISIIQGMHKEFDDNIILQTPLDFGVEQAEKVMKCSKSQGEVECYSQSQVIFYCKSNISEDQKIWVRNYAIGENDLQPKNDHIYNITYEYTLVLTVKNSSDKKKISLIANCICPMVRFSQANIKFGACNLYDRKDMILIISNSNPNLDVTIEAGYYSNYSITPNKFIIKGDQSHRVIITFKPKTLGKYSDNLVFTINKNFDITIKVTGNCLNNKTASKQKRIKGPALTSDNFYQKPKFIDPYNTSNNYNIYNISLTTTNDINNVNNIITQTSNKNINQYKINKENKDKYIEYMRRNNKNFIVKTEKRKLSPKIETPKALDTLFVSKPIGNYEPYNINLLGVKFVPDNNTFFKEFPSSPDNHIDLRDCQKELDPLSLQKIHVGPTTLDFGKIFIKSEAVKYFQIKNELRTAISARIDIQVSELSKSYPDPQIIPSGKVAGFKIVVCSNEKKQINQLVTYKINEKHSFKFLVKADIIPVELELSTYSIKLIFNDDNISLYAKKSFQIINKGNSNASFKWTYPANSPFSISPAEGFVGKNSSLTVDAVYLPTGNKIDESESLTMDVADGTKLTLKCMGTNNESKYEFSKEVVNFGVIPISQSVSDFLILKNTHTKNYLIFEIDTSMFPEGLTVSPIKGKITPDENQRFDINYKSFNEIDMLNGHDIPIKLRGGKIIKGQIKVSTIIPKVKILQEDINFGNITTGNFGYVEIEIENSSLIAAQLILNLNEETEFKEQYKGMHYLSIEYLNKADDESMVIEEKDPYEIGGKKQERKLNDIDNINSDNDSEEDNHYAEPKNSRIYVINIKPKKKYNFMLKFSPEFEKDYSFELPIFLAGDMKTEGLRRFVKCTGVSSKLVMSPSNGIVEFKKQIISNVDSVVPDFIKIELYNPSNFVVDWTLDTNDIDVDRVFTILPTSGNLDPKSTVSLKVGFKPLVNQIYERKIPVYVSNDFVKPYLEIRLKGEGAYPRLLFDRREIIMPIVPLNIESKIYFKLFNDGYKNTNLKYYFPQDIGAINLKLLFPEGQNLSSNITKLKIGVQFLSKKPISFTTRLDIEDEQRRIYSIYLSGTADNSLLTNFHFIKSHEYEYNIDTVNSRNVNIVNKNIEDDRSISMQKSVNMSKGVSNNSNSVKSSGFSIPSLKELERASNHIMKWLNEFVLETDINCYPNDVINQNGVQIYELLGFLVKKVPVLPVKIENNLRKTEKIEKLITQYNTLINYLKENGALLNNIRSDYLLSYNDFMLMIKNNPPKNVNIQHLRLSENKFKYISLDSWNILFYQILKIFYMTRVNSKKLKQNITTLIESLESIQVLPDYLNEKSNIYSYAELIILRWFEIIYIKCNNNPNHRIKTFDLDFKSGVLLTNALKVYIGGSADITDTIKTTFFSIDDYKSNMEKIKYVLSEFGLMSVLELNDFVDISPREMFLFLVHLFLLLPQYIPRQKIEFNCLLNQKIVKYITLTNSNPKGILYMIKFEAHKNFEIDTDYIKIEPNQTINFPIYFKPSISLPVSGRITFKNRKDAGTIGEALVFDLVSNVTGRESREIREITNIKLYEGGLCDIEITNPFDSDGEFYITIENTDKNYNNTKDTKAKNIKKPKRIFIPSFYCKQDKIKIKKKGKNKISIYYLPITYENHSCNIILCDEKVGEMQYEIKGIPDLPNPIETIKINDYIDSNKPHEIVISQKNNLLNSALYMLEEKTKDLRTEFFKDQVNNVISLVRGLDNNAYEIEISPNNNIFTFNQTFSFPNNLNKTSNNNMDKSLNDSTFLNNYNRFGGSPENSYTLKLVPQYRNIYKEYHQTILIKNNHLTDIKIYELIITINPKRTKGTLEFRTPVGIQIEQNIPIANPFDRQQTFKVSFYDIKNGTNFNYSNNNILAKSATTNFQLIFKPDWIGESEARLHIKNNATNESFDYELVGIGEEPLALDNFEIITKVKEPYTLEIPIKNNQNNIMTYRVESDIVYAEFQKEIEVTPFNVYPFIIKITPNVGGEFMGSITFYDQNDHYFWYTMNIKAESLRSEKTLQISSTVRTEAVSNIELVNNNDEEIVYNVSIEGEGLNGNQLIKINPFENVNYELFFTPYHAFKDKGSISFYNERYGEIWYELYLISEEAEAIKLPVIKSELGKLEAQDIQLRNPSSFPAKVKVQISNNINFIINESTFTIPSKSDYKINLYYSPSDLDKIESGIIIFTSDEIGKWTYYAYGSGLPPTKYKETLIYALDKQDKSTSIYFKNPFKNEIGLTVDLVSEDKTIFNLLLKKNKFVVKGYSSVQIPFSFHPREIKEYNAEIILFLSDKIFWTYPIKGISEAPPYVCPDKSFDIKVKCNKKIEKNMSFPISNITADDLNDEFSIDIHLNNKEYNKLVKKWIYITEKKHNIEGGFDTSLEYFIKFEPLKPFKASGEFVITKKSGGRWKFKFQLESMEPDPEQVIHISSNINTTSMMKFKLYSNNSRVSVPFKAEFTSDSASEFNVSPTSGKLEPMIKNGTVFTVSFTPIEYGKVKYGNLIIESDEFYKFFKIVGTFPQYKPPKIRESQYSIKNIMNKK